MPPDKVPAADGLNLQAYLLKVRVALALIAGAVLTNLICGSWTVHTAYRALKEQKQQDELVIADNIATQADEDFTKARSVLSALAEDPLIAGTDRARQRNILTVSARASGILDGIAVLDLEGKTVVMDEFPPDTRAMLPSDPKKHIIRPLMSAGADIFFGTFQAGAMAEPMVSVSVPIRRQGRVEGVLAGLIVLKYHSLGGTEQIRFGQNGYAYLVDAGGQAIRHPKRRQFLEDLSAFAPVKAFLEHRRGAAEVVNQEGVELLAAFSPVGSTGWGVIVRQPTDESYAYAKQIVYYLILAALLNILAAGAIGLFLAGVIAGPLMSLAEDIR